MTTTGIKRETDKKQGDMQALEPNKLFKQKSKLGVPSLRGTALWGLEVPRLLTKAKVCLGSGRAVLWRRFGLLSRHPTHYFDVNSYVLINHEHIFIVSE